jgi:hypothetical protein
VRFTVTANAVLRLTIGHVLTDEDDEDFFKEFDVDLDFDDASEEPAAAPSMPPPSPGKDEYPVETQGGDWL